MSRLNYTPLPLFMFKYQIALTLQNRKVVGQDYVLLPSSGFGGTLHYRPNLGIRGKNKSEGCICMS